MSDQSKEQSLGYMLKACFDSGTSREELRGVYFVAKQGIKNVFDESGNHTMNNYVTDVVLRESLRTIEKEWEYIQKATSNLHGAFDMFTVEQAREFYEAFKVIVK